MAYGIFIKDGFGGASLDLTEANKTDAAKHKAWLINKRGYESSEICIIDAPWGELDAIEDSLNNGDSFSKAKKAGKAAIAESV